MYRFIVQYFQPEDPEHFKKYYEEVHVAMGAHPLIKRRFYTFDVGGVSEKGQLSDSEVFCYFEADFETKEDFLEYCSLMEKAVADVKNYATGKVIAMHFAVP